VKNSKNDFIQDCIDLSDAMSTQACGIVALGELLMAADPELIDGDTLSGLGHLLTIVASAMFDESEQGSKYARMALQPASKAKRVRTA
jgi:hypothetical protein